jgi:hypothetical protein
MGLVAMRLKMDRVREKQVVMRWGDGPMGSRGRKQHLCIPLFSWWSGRKACLRGLRSNLFCAMGSLFCSLVQPSMKALIFFFPAIATSDTL